MDLNDIANALFEACSTGQERQALETLYAADAVSVEAIDDGQGREAQGRAAISGKHDWWEANFDVIEADVGGPFLHAPDRFALTFSLKAKHKESGEVSDMSEVALYHVSGGKIVREEFFYS